MSRTPVVGIVTLIVVVAVGMAALVLNGPGRPSPISAAEACNFMDMPYDSLITLSVPGEELRTEIRDSGPDRHVMITATSPDSTLIGKAELIIKDRTRYSRESTLDNAEVFGKWLVHGTNVSRSVSLPCLDPGSFEDGTSGSSDEPDFRSEKFLSEEEGAVRNEFWTDSTGRPTRARRTIFPPEYDGVSNTETAIVEFTYSGYGVSNIIEAPCARAAPDEANNPGLMRDCIHLLATKDTLRGTGSLNWSTSTAISTWDGVTTGGTPTRITKVELDSESLTGVIPAGLGSLFELTHLKLNSNTLTGSIPRELGWLYNLEEIKLSGNSLTGCIPIALEDVGTNDLSSLNLLYCRPPSPEGLSGTQTETSIALSWGAVSSTTKYRVEYREALPIDWTTATETLTTTSHSFSDLACGTPYQFRVSAFGSGTTYSAAWSEPSAILSADTGECVTPTFDEESYDFTVSAHAAVRTAIATVSATDPNGDSITYSITAGNTGNKFGINSSTGALTVEASFGGTSSTAALTVRASDGTNMATTTVNVTVEGSKITFSGLESSLERWDLINFEVDAENLDPTRSHTLEVTSSNTNMVFNNPFRCVGSSTSWSRPPPASSIKSGAILLHACRVPGGTITAVLKHGTTTLLTERFAVAVSLPATPRLPSIEFVNLSPTPMQGMVDPFSVRAFYLGETTSYTIRVTTDNANLGFDSTCSIRFHEHETTASNITAFRLLRLHACSAPGGTLTASLLRNGSVVATASENIAVRLPANPSIEISGLASKLVEGRSDSFDVTATNLTTNSSFYLELRTSSRNLGFNSGCSISSDEVVPARGQTTHSATFILHACTGPAGTVTAALIRGTRTVDTATFNVTIVAPPENAPSTPTGLSASLANDAFTLSWDALDGAAKYEPQYGTGDSTITWTALPETTTTGATYSPTDGPDCGTKYNFRVRAFGDDTTFTDAWGAPSAAQSIDTEACNVPPEFDPMSYTFSIAENIAAGTAVGTVTASDEDTDDELSYSITSGNTGDVFAITETSGAITVTGALDHETTASYSLTVEVDDGREGTDTATVAITVTDVAEDTPPAPENLDASLAGSTFSLSWDSLSGAANYEPQYRTGDSDDDWMELPTTTGVSTTFSPTGGPACGTTYGFRVRAYGDGTTYIADWGTPSAADSVTTDACNIPPAFDPASFTFSVAENAATGTSVGSVTATDDDTDDELSYAITNGNTGDVFAINETTGTVTVARALDHETAAAYTLTVEVDDGREGTDTATVAITVTDVAEDTPPAPENLEVSVTDDTFSLSWDAISGAANYEPQYRTGDSDDDWMALPTTSGTSATFSPAGGAACGTTYSFRVRVYGDATKYIADWGTPSATDSFTTDGCVAPEFDPATYTFSAADNVAVGASVGTVTATDENNGDTVSYTIVDADVPFSIGSTSGEISVNGALDYDRMPSYTLTVQATDRAGLTVTATVTVTVIAVPRQGERELWNGTMTAGPMTIGRADVFGYTSGVSTTETTTEPSGTIEPSGTMQNATFEYGGQTYTIELAAYVHAVNGAKLFFVGLAERPLPSDTTLVAYVNGHRLSSWQTTEGIDTYNYYSDASNFTVIDRQVVSLSLYKTNPSDDSTLSALTLSTGTLTPDFDAGTTSYSATVSSTATSITITAEAMSDYATVDVSPSGGDDPSTDGVEVTVGDQPTTVTVTVTAEDGSTTDYSVTVTRESA